jgi:hypothetical protein
MRTPFKLKSGNTSSFKNMGAFPAKQSNPSSWYKGSKSTNASMNIDLSKMSKKAQLQKLTKVKKPTSTLSRVTKALKNTPKQLVKGGKQILKKGGKFLGGKTLGVAGMMMATSSKADQPKNKKSEGQQIKDLLTKHKLKGGNN